MVKKMLKQDYHVHSMLSFDCESDLDAICRHGIELGLEEVILTDHYEMFEGATTMQSYHKHYVRYSREQVLACRARWEGKIFLGFGIELGQWHHQPEAAQMVLAANHYDYVLASLHRLEHREMFQTDFSKVDRVSMREHYLEELMQIAETGDYDCLAHFDLIKRYAAFQGISLRMEDLREATHEILKTVIRRGRGLEVNTSGLGTVLQEPLPSPEILRWYRQLGGEIITVGSDAHTLDKMAGNYERAEALIRNLGFRYIARYHQRKVSFVPI